MIAFFARYAGLLMAAQLIAGTALAQTPEPPGATAVATFASGCFWCTEADFDKVDGVTATVSGFMGGKTKNPTYEDVARKITGHTEVVQVTYDPRKVTYRKLLDWYWRNVDPVDAGGQFCDRGESYRPAIFVHTDAQRAEAEASKMRLENSGRFSQPIVVKIETATPFYAAEDWHQDYYTKNPIRYKIYRHGCGRDSRLYSIWGDVETN